jgi:hypothetical protein
MLAPIRVKASRSAGVGSVSMGTSVWVPGERIWLRVRAAEDVSGAAAQVNPVGLPFAPSFPQAPTHEVETAARAGGSGCSQR